MKRIADTDTNIDILVNDSCGTQTLKKQETKSSVLGSFLKRRHQIGFLLNTIILMLLAAIGFYILIKVNNTFIFICQIKLKFSLNEEKYKYDKFQVSIN